MSDGNNYAQNWFAQDGGVGQQITSLISQLDALNIPVIAATGNSFTGQQGQGFPSIVPDTISVTSTNAGGTQLSSDAQRLGSEIGGSSATDIAAPGEGLVAPVQNNQYATVDGTSFAAAEVSGAVVLMQQIYESRFGTLPSVDQIDTWLKDGADPVSDPVTDLAIGLLDIPRAASFIPTPPPVTTPSSTSSSGPQTQVLIPPDSSAVAALLAGPSGSSNSSVPVSPSDTGNNASSGGSTTSSTPASNLSPAQPPQPAPTTPPTTTQTTASGDQPSAETIGQTTLAQRLWSFFSPAVFFNSAQGGAGRAQVWTNIPNTQKGLGNNAPAGQIKPLLGANDHPKGAPSLGTRSGHSPFVRRWMHG
jgi:type VI secretion system secreted protein VgrG